MLELFIENARKCIAVVVIVSIISIIKSDDYSQEFFFRELILFGIVLFVMAVILTLYDFLTLKMKNKKEYES